MIANVENINGKYGVPGVAAFVYVKPEEVYPFSEATLIVVKNFRDGEHLYNLLNDAGYDANSVFSQQEDDTKLQIISSYNKELLASPEEDYVRAALSLIFNTEL